MAHVKTQSEWELEMCGKIIEYIEGALYVDMRFLEPVFHVLVPRANVTLSSLATDGVYIYMNTAHIIDVFGKNERFLMRAYLHTVLHCVYGHLWMSGGRNFGLWGLACDIAVERIIDSFDKPSVKRILTWRRQKIYARLDEKRIVSAAQIYELLLGESDDELVMLQKEFFTDDHTLWQYDNARKSMMNRSEKIQKQWENRARKVNAERQRQHAGSDGEEDNLDELMRVERRKRSYGEFLRKFAEYHEEMKVSEDEFDLGYYTYGLMLYKNLPLIEPLETTEIQRIREFAVVIDTSYSTSGELVRRFLQETFDILMSEDAFFKVSRIRVIQCDDVIQSDDVITDRAQIEHFFDALEIRGGGSTDFRPPFKYIDSLIDKGEIDRLGGVLYFTDGEGTYPKRRPRYKTAFVFMGNYDESAVPPWAMRIRVYDTAQRRIVQERGAI